MRCRTIPGLLAAALQAIERRRAKLLADRQQVASLGFPLRQRGSPQTYAVRPSVLKQGSSDRRAAQHRSPALLVSASVASASFASPPHGVERSAMRRREGRSPSDPRGRRRQANERRLFDDKPRLTTWSAAPILCALSGWIEADVAAAAAAGRSEQWAEGPTRRGRCSETATWHPRFSSALCSPS